ncbi:MAG: NAD(P)(+) transhydrogenase (Re/Si-specific) subunit beta [Acidobacteriota bacterium]|jgi:NAD(P) transhydrogenase subunit beta
MLNLLYLLAAVAFIFGLKMLSSPRTAVPGNLLAAAGMLVAVVATLLVGGVVDLPLVLAGIAVGALVGALLAVFTPMTAMPEMVALLNGFGGAASALVAGAEMLRIHAVPEESFALVPVIAIALSLLIGSVTFTGSMVAFLRLREWLIGGRPTVFAGQHLLNLLLFLAAVAAMVAFARDPHPGPAVYALVAVAALLGVLVVIPIGGADMPVVICLLNSYSGLAAATTGFVIINNGLIISGSLVGASGIILTNIMCKAMNRSFTNVLLGGFGATVSAGGGGQAGANQRVRSADAEEAAMILEAARTVVIAPGYGMAVAQAQHAVKELADELERRGVDIKYAIHPVAGRMPGHMNVLLAEANVPYEQLYEMDQINPSFGETDVVLVIGANDVVNPAAKTDPASPIYGMPVLDVEKARTVMVIKRSLNPGFAGIDNPLYYLPNTMMLFGDAKKMAVALAQAVKNV